MDLKFINVSLTGNNYEDDLLKNIELVHMPSNVSDEINMAKAKCTLIDKIEGSYVKIKGFTLKGVTDVETISLTFIKNNKDHYREYKIDDFYSL